MNLYFIFFKNPEQSCSKNQNFKNRFKKKKLLAPVARWPTIVSRRFSDSSRVMKFDTSELFTRE